jgi:hypothetical protein
MVIENEIIVTKHQNNYGVSYNNYDILFVKNFNITQLKQICKSYKLKITGKKVDLVERLYQFLKSYKYVVKIQKVFRGFLYRKIDKLKGEGLFDRSKCVNETDFLSMDELKLIPPLQFFSYTEYDGKIYGFNILSIFNLINKEKNKQPINPYTRNIISDKVVNDIYKIICLSKICKQPISIAIKNEMNELSNKKKIEMKILDIFQYINSLGNYSEPNWFLSLTKIQLYKFFRELSDIWNYRANISEETKIKICPPNGILFTHAERTHIYHENNQLILQLKISIILEKMLYSGVDNDSKVLGAYYILAALTLVSQDAATSMSWLYQSVYY